MRWCKVRSWINSTIGAKLEATVLLHHPLRAGTAGRDDEALHVTKHLGSNFFLEKKKFLHAIWVLLQTLWANNLTELLDGESVCFEFVERCIATLFSFLHCTTIKENNVVLWSWSRWSCSANLSDKIKALIYIQNITQETYVPAAALLLFCV